MSGQKPPSSVLRGALCNTCASLFLRLGVCVGPQVPGRAWAARDATFLEARPALKRASHTEQHTSCFVSSFFILFLRLGVCVGPQVPGRAWAARDATFLEARPALKRASHTEQHTSCFVSSFFILFLRLGVCVGPQVPGRAWAARDATFLEARPALKRASHTEQHTSCFVSSFFIPPAAMRGRGGVACHAQFGHSWLGCTVHGWFIGIDLFVRIDRCCIPPCTAC